MDDASLNFFLGAYEREVHQSLDALQKDRILDRIWARDYTVWKPAPDEIVNRLGWLDAPRETLEHVAYIHSVLDPIIRDGIESVVLLGMGGSSLAAEVYNEIFGREKGCPVLHILDTTDSAAIARITKKITLGKSLFIVSSKSGGTLETISLFQYFYNLVLKESGKSTGRHFIIITDPGSSLEELANRFSLRHVFLSDSSIGGRYSALSYPGIIPAALIGIDIEKLLQNALAAANREVADAVSLKTSPGILLGAALGTLAKAGRDKLTLIFPPQLKSFGFWLEQLIAESTGKEGKGILPLCGEPLNEPSYYNNDRVFVIFRQTGKEKSAKISALIAAGHPVIAVKMESRYDIGGQILLWEMATAVASHIFGVNPFQQPNVEATKVITHRMIGLYRDKRELPQEKAALVAKDCHVYGCRLAKTPPEALADFLSGATGNTYICLQIYLHKRPGIDAALCQLRAAISRKYGFAVTIGYGPRYLHSTGQLHKGDAGRGLFIQFTSDERQIIEIPDRPGAAASTLTFGTLKSAQAMGDRQALIDLGRKVIRFHFGKNIAGQIKDLANYLKKS